MESTRRIGVREIAAACGLSFATVAAALRGETWVRADKLQLIRATAEKLGYQRDAAAAILGSRRGRKTDQVYSLAYLSTTFGARFRKMVQPRLMGLDEAARARGFQFERIELHSDQHAQQVGRRLLATGVDGLIVGQVEPGSFLATFDISRFSVVAENRDMVGHGVESVRANHFKATTDLLRQITRLGYQRIGVILRYHAVLHADDLSRLGATMAFRETEARPASLEILRWPFLTAGEDEAGQKQRELQELIKWQRRHRFEVIVGYDRTDAHHVRELSRRLSTDVDFVALTVRAGDRGQLAGMQYDQEALITPMITRLIEKIQTRTKGVSDRPVETVVPLAWLDGASLRRSHRAEPAGGPT